MLFHGAFIPGCKQSMMEFPHHLADICPECRGRVRVPCTSVIHWPIFPRLSPLSGSRWQLVGEITAVNTSLPIHLCAGVWCDWCSQQLNKRLRAWGEERVEQSSPSSSHPPAKVELDYWCFSLTGLLDFSEGSLEVLLPYLKMGGYMCAAAFLSGCERSHLLIPRRSSAQHFPPVLSGSGATHRVRRLVQEDRYRRSGLERFRALLHPDVNSWCVPAWNSALYCESHPDRMRDFFLLSYQASMEVWVLGSSRGMWCGWFCDWRCFYWFFVIKWQLSHLCPPDRGLLLGQKTCLLMAAAASLELCRKSLLSDQVHHPLPLPRLPHLASSSSTRMEMYQEQQRRGVTNAAGASVGVFIRIPPSSLKRTPTLDGNIESRICTFVLMVAACTGSWRGATSPPGRCQGALEQGTTPQCCFPSTVEWLHPATYMCLMYIYTSVCVSVASMA